MHSLPPLPTPVYGEMRAEACCGCSLVLGIIIVLVGSTHASLTTTHNLNHGPTEFMRSVGLTLIYSEAAVAILCLLGLMWGDPGATTTPDCPGVAPRAQAPAPPVRRCRQAHARDLLPAPRRGGRAAPQRPLARGHGQHNRRRSHLLHPLPRLAARGRARGGLLPVLRRRRRSKRVDTPLRHLPALRDQLRPPLRRIRPLHCGDTVHGEHALLQRYHPDGCRGLHHLHRVLLHGRRRLRAATRAPPEGGQSRMRPATPRLSSSRPFSMGDACFTACLLIVILFYTLSVCSLRGFKSVATKTGWGHKPRHATPNWNCGPAPAARPRALPPGTARPPQPPVFPGPSE